MAATIIQFPQQQSVAFMNLTQLVELASDNLMVEGYAKLMEDCYRKSEFRPGEFETLQEQIRKKTPGKCKTEKETCSGSNETRVVLLHFGDGRSETGLPDRGRTELL